MAIASSSVCLCCTLKAVKSCRPLTNRATILISVHEGTQCLFSVHLTDIMTRRTCRCEFSGHCSVIGYICLILFGKDQTIHTEVSCGFLAW